MGDGCPNSIGCGSETISEPKIFKAMEAFFLKFSPWQAILILLGIVAVVAGSIAYGCYSIEENGLSFFNALCLLPVILVIIFAFAVVGHAISLLRAIKKRG